MLVLGGLGEYWNYPNEVTNDPSQQGEGSGLREPMWSIINRWFKVWNLQHLSSKLLKSLYNIRHKAKDETFEKIMKQCYQK